METCSICGQHSTKLKPLSETGKDVLATLSKLVESEIATEGLICSACIKQLHAVHKFRLKCLNSERLLFRPTFQSLEVDVEIKKEETQYDDADYTRDSSEDNEPLLKRLPNLIPAAEVKNEPPPEMTGKKRRGRKPKLIVEPVNGFYICDFASCGKRFPNILYLKKHVPIHKARKSYICSSCGLSYLTPTGLRMHELNKHKDLPAVLKCSRCPKSFALADKLKKHERTHDYNSRKIECAFCGMKFIDKYKLIRHFLTHNDQRPYRCSLCSYAARQNSRLKEHMKTH